MTKYYELGSRELTDKIHSNQEFLKEMESCDTVKELYDLYIKYDYTDKPYEEFEKYFAYMKAALDSYDKNQEVAEKIKNDTKFLDEIKTCKSEKELYDTYVKYGYANISFEEFKKAFNDKLMSLSKAGTIELTEDELDAIVGGSFSSWLSTITGFIPFVGGFVSTIVDVAAGNIHGAGNIAARFGAATIKCLFDTVTTIATAGVGLGASLAIRGGIMALSGGTSFVTKAATNDDGFLH